MLKYSLHSNIHYVIVQKICYQVFNSEIDIFHLPVCVFSKNFVQSRKLKFGVQVLQYNIPSARH